MTARALIVGTSIPRTKPIERALAAASFDVAVATRAEDCLMACREGRFDVVLMDATSSDEQGIELCRRVKSEPAIAHIPVVVMTEEGEPSRRLQALDAGADEHLSLPADEVVVATRVRSLAQLKALSDDARRVSNIRGVSPVDGAAAPERPARVLVLDPDARSQGRLAALLSGEFQVAGCGDPAKALMRTAEGAYDVAIVSLDWPDTNGLKLCRQLRLVDPMANLRLLLLSGGEEMQLRRIEGSGADDLLLRPIDRNETIARVRVAVRKSRLATMLRKAESVVEKPIQYRVSSLNRRPPDRFAA